MDGLFAPRDNGDLCSVYRATHEGTGRLRAALRAFERAHAYHPDAAARLDPKIDQLKRSLGQS